MASSDHLKTAQQKQRQERTEFSCPEEWERLFAGKSVVVLKNKLLIWILLGACFLLVTKTNFYNHSLDKY